MNSEIAKILYELAMLMDMKGIAFKPRAFEKAGHAVETLQEDVENIYKKGGIKALEEIPGVGQGIAERIEEYLKHGHIKDYEHLKKEIPIDIADLSAIEGLGPKTILLLYRKLKIRNRAQLEKAAKAGKLSNIRGLGAKTQANILRGITFLKQSHGRLFIGGALPMAQAIADALREVSGVTKVEYAGSIRRMQETVGDIDLLAISDKPELVMDAFASLPQVRAVYSRGSTKTSVRLKIGVDADLRVLPSESFGAALQYFTGDKYHNVQLRQAAIKKGYKLNEYGLYKGNKLVAGKTEAEIYEKLGFDWMPPELRTNHGELEAAAQHTLPHVIDYDDLKGDLQIQTDWTDGEDSIEAMAKAAHTAGLEYICITDHTKSLTITGGLDEKRLHKQMAEIDRINKKLGGKFHILKGTECDIHKDGSLDLPDSILSQLDFVGASVHSYFNLPEKEQTARIIRAMENPNVDIMFHPTGRIVLERDAYKVDMDQLLKAAKRTKTIMEINASNRLDLKDEYIRKAVDLGGVRFAIDSDAHAVSQFAFLPYGIAQARRGWAEKKDIINTCGWQEMLKLLK